MTPPTRVLVVDDDPMVRQVYRTLLHALPDFELCGEAADGEAGIARFAALQPDLVLMDLQMPRCTGTEATAQICARWPDACIVVLTTFGTQDHVVAALQAGAAGYLTKDVGAPGLVTGMRQALAGDMPMTGPVRRELARVIARPERPQPAAAELSEREIEVLHWLAHGLTNAQIGTRMHVSEGSVKQHLLTSGAKLGVRSRTSILVRAIQLGVVDPARLTVEA